MYEVSKRYIIFKKRNSTTTSTQFTKVIIYSCGHFICQVTRDVDFVPFLSSSYIAQLYQKIVNTICCFILRIYNLFQNDR